MFTLCGFYFLRLIKIRGRFVEPCAAPISKSHAGALVNLGHLFPIIQIGPASVGHPIHLSRDSPISPLQHRVTPVIDLDEAIDDAVAVSFGAPQQVMGAAVAFQ